MKKIFYIALALLSALCMILALPACGGAEENKWKNASGKPTVLDIGSEGCYACVELEPTLNRLIREYGYEIDFITFEAWYTDEGIAVAEEFNVKSYPTLIFLDPSGNEVKRMVGAYPYASYKNTFVSLGWIEQP